MRVCPACLSEEVQTRYRHAQGRTRRNRPKTQTGKRGLPTMVGRRASDISVKAGSGNVFADMGLPEPMEELTKAQLASQIRDVIKRRRLTQAAAASVMGIDQPKVSALC